MAEARRDRKDACHLQPANSTDKWTAADGLLAGAACGTPKDTSLLSRCRPSSLPGTSRGTQESVKTVLQGEALLLKFHICFLKLLQPALAPHCLRPSEAAMPRLSEPLAVEACPTCWIKVAGRRRKVASKLRSALARLSLAVPASVQHRSNRPFENRRQEEGRDRCILEHKCD